MPNHQSSQPGQPNGTRIADEVQQSDTERLATVGRLVTKIAHELNNPLDGILRYLNLSMRALEQDNLEKPKEYLQQCRRGLMRMVQITSELLEFARTTYSTSHQQVTVESVIEDAIKTMSSTAEAQQVSFVRNYQERAPKIKCGNLFGVFSNLIKNALDAMPNGGELRISTRPQADNTIAIEFRDTGCGFATEDAKAIFEPFFTTKERGRGTGLGLAICRDITNQYKGRITAENAPDRGSIFTVYMPAAQGG